MVMLGLLNAFYLHLSALLTVALFAFAGFGLIGVVARLALARYMVRSTDQRP